MIAVMKPVRYSVSRKMQRRSRRQVRIARIAGLLAVATLAASQDIAVSPAAAASGAPKLSVSYPGVRVAGEPFEVNGRGPSSRYNGTYNADLQSRSGSGWRTVASTIVASTGRYGGDQYFLTVVPARRARAVTLRIRLRKGSRTVAVTSAERLSIKAPRAMSCVRFLSLAREDAVYRVSEALADLFRYNKAACGTTPPAGGQDDDFYGRNLAFIYRSISFAALDVRDKALSREAANTFSPCTQSSPRPREGR